MPSIHSHIQLNLPPQAFDFLEVLVSTAVENAAQYTPDIRMSLDILSAHVVLAADRRRTWLASRRPVGRPKKHNPI